MVRIGIDVGGTGIQIGIVDENGTILHKGQISTNIAIPFSDQVRDIALCALDTLKGAGYTTDDLLSVGVGIPGIADQKTGEVIKCTNMSWDFVPFKDEFIKYINKPLFIDNDATVAGLAESKAGVSAGTSSSVFITIGTGIGAGIVINGKVWSGAHGIGSELGHMIIRTGGEQCTCGNKGCVERYCSATAIIRMAREKVQYSPESEILKLAGNDPAAINAKNVFDAAKNGDPAALEVFSEYIAYTGQAIANIVNFLDPEVIVIGGGVSKAGDFLLDALKKEFPKYVIFRTQPLPRLLIAKLGADAGIIGAAMLG